MSEKKLVFFFDVDNCLYSSTKKVSQLMQGLIDEYFAKHLELSPEDAAQLHARYYKDYGLALEGLVRHHRVDPMEYNRQVDDALPLEEVITPDPQLRELLEDFDKSKIKLWLFTNAYVTHGKRVARLLGVDDLFDGITYCDYASAQFLCKPHKAMFEKAEKDAGAESPQCCFFVDDSALNVKGAELQGWTAVQLIEPAQSAPPERVGSHQIQSLQELKQIFPNFFKSTDKNVFTG